MKFSLVTATLGRVDELKTLFDSLFNQTYKNFELIIVDQNDHYKLQELVDLYSEKLDINYIRSSIKGLSYNRNLGIKVCTGDIIAFPDDDCYYSSNVLESVLEQFSVSSPSLVLIEAVDPSTGVKYISKSDNVTKMNLMKSSLSCNIFLPLNQSFLFDENMGVGTYFSSGEETDYLWQQIKEQSKIVFTENAYMYHLQGGYNSFTFSKAYKYGLGFGALFKKEIILRKNYQYFPMYFKYLIRSLGGLILTMKYKVYLGSLFGRIVGFIKYKV
ncbi:glycosyltransferase family 2 protein [Lonepinella koalarum]|uniref:glycosyltransferase family 2 protein n=1 Tax=Lonepinella koalarum TaxID=53417 RepID=UPI003F6DF09F